MPKLKAQWIDASPPLLRLSLEAPIHALLERLPRSVENVLTHPERSPKVIKRLFPATYGDPLREEEHRQLLGTSLLERRLQGLETYALIVARSNIKKKIVQLDLTRPEVDLMMQVINDFRLLLATEMDIVDNDWMETFDVESADRRTFAELAATSAVQQVLIGAMS